MKTHRMYGSPTYKSWSEMKYRVKHTKGWDHLQYDISWEKFIGFFNDMGLKPNKKSLDRIDNTKGYYKENCRWATSIEQNNNRSSSVFYLYKGDKLSLSQLARKYDISRSNLANKIYIYHLTIDDAMNYLIGVGQNR